MEPPAPRASAPTPRGRPRRGLSGAVVLAALLVWTVVVQLGLGGQAIGGNVTGTTTTTSFKTSSETVTTTETVRADAFATRLVVTNGIGGVVSDQNLPGAFADASVQQAVAAARTALLGGEPGVSS